MSKETKRVIIIGFGNELRGDDGLGPKLLDSIKLDVEKIKLQEITFDLIEDIKNFDIVIFVDASIEGEDVSFRKVKKESRFSPLTHNLSLEELLIWAETLNKRNYDFYLLSIRGYNFEFGMDLSEKAKKNLMKAKSLLVKFIEEKM